MKRFKGTLLALLVLVVLSLAAANAFAATESGYLGGPGAYYHFRVDAGSNTDIEVTFSYPRGSVDFWVQIRGQDNSTVLGDLDLDNGESIQLTGGGTFYLTIYSKRGAGNWTASWGGGGGGGKSPGNCNVGDTSAWGYLSGAGDSCAFSLNSFVQDLYVNFSASGGSTNFWVEVVGEDGRTVLGNYKISPNNNIHLSGGGMFYITVYSNGGAGNWSCSW